jgi:hypothetical protein
LEFGRTLLIKNYYLYDLWGTDSANHAESPSPTSRSEGKAWHGTLLGFPSVPYDVSALETEHLTGGVSQNLLVVQDEPGRSLEWKTVRTMAFAVATPNRFPFKRRESRRFHIPWARRDIHCALLNK